ncbi:hypothetical protein D187_010035 [Cystobacter fuscus DSM 2262]|uniref:Periplasmic heavy metal sensor n=1 Tax=Cystobacter fuscus (strain ATCC 25194 / DSM 2262 / NBRC 100088 / M29) TaxID=1242864 RepID=S9PGG4_CYSF2|nr:periplasmic heavy metal sensor [Cystobacter fuscus]EPX62131.1 hypothetical protein D187_010035 [Cystobacter fuscus DSM 2262]
MMKNLWCVLGILGAVPAFAQDKQTVVTVNAEKGSGSERSVHIVRTRGGPLGPASSGIPPELVEKLELPKATVRKVQDLIFDSNQEIISLEAEHKRTQLALERELRQDAPNESTVKDLVEKVGRAETAVRQNRVALMVTIKKILGPDTWRKLEAEMNTHSFPMPPVPPFPPAFPAAPAPRAPPAAPAPNPGP